jgi:hypothetical protein
MFLNTLLLIRKEGVVLQGLEDIAKTVEVPNNDTFGECLPWVMKVIRALCERGSLDVSDINALQEELESFAAGNKSYARRDRLPNMAVSPFAGSP